MENEYERLVREAGLPPEALPSDAFFCDGAEREVDRAKAAAAGVPATAAGEAADPAYQAALARAQAIADAKAAHEDINAIEERRAALRHAATPGAPVPPVKIGVLLSGSGTNLQALIDAIAAGSLNAQIVLVVSSRPSAQGLKRAEAAGIQTLSLSKDIYADPITADEVIATELYRAGAEFVVMAGYMRMVHAPLLATFPNRVINIHPALLPSFQGAHGIADAYARGVKVTGVTVHIANEVYDQGPILAQKPVRIEESWSLDELECTIHRVEHKLYPHVVQLLAEGRIHVNDDLTVAIER